MFSSKGKAERTAAQAWDYLSSAMTTAGENAVQAGRQTAGTAGETAVKLAERAGHKGQRLAERAGHKGQGLADKAGRKSQKLAGKAGRKGAELAGRAGSKADEAWARASAAADALAGRKPGRPWGLIAGATLVGVALGWAAAGTVRAALERQAANEQLELAETAVVVTPFAD